MGLDIQSKKFWRLTPNNFINMYIGFKKRQQTEMLMVRKLISFVSATAGVQLKEQDIAPLSFVDEPIIVKKFKPPTMTQEEIDKANERYVKIKAELTRRKQEKSKLKK